MSIISKERHLQRIGNEDRIYFTPHIYWVLCTLLCRFILEQICTGVCTGPFGVFFFFSLYLAILSRVNFTQACCKHWPSFWFITYCYVYFCNGWVVFRRVHHGEKFAPSGLSFISKMIFEKCLRVVLMFLSGHFSKQSSKSACLFFSFFFFLAVAVLFSQDRTPGYSVLDGLSNRTFFFC